MSCHICDQCKSPECCHDLVMRWKKIRDGELDGKICDFMKCTKTDFVTTRSRFMTKSHILDNDFSARLEEAFMRLAPLYVDPVTEDLIRKWERMNDEDVEHELVHIQAEKSAEEFYRIWAFLYPEELKARLEKLLLHNVIPKVRHVRLIRMINRWEHLPDEELASEVKRELLGTGWNSSTSHFTFVRDLYPNIESEILRKRVDSVLLSLMDPRKPTDSDMALYACSHLNVTGTVEAYQELVRQMRQDSKNK